MIIIIVKIIEFSSYTFVIDLDYNVAMVNIMYNLLKFKNIFYNFFSQIYRYLREVKSPWKVGGQGRGHGGKFLMGRDGRWGHAPSLWIVIVIYNILPPQLILILLFNY